MSKFFEDTMQGLLELVEIEKGENPYPRTKEDEAFTNQLAKEIEFEEMYAAIVAKIGFDPKEYIPELKPYECDHFKSPFEVLTVEELEFLLRNKCFPQK